MKLACPAAQADPNKVLHPAGSRTDHARRSARPENPAPLGTNRGFLSLVCLLAVLLSLAGPAPASGQIPAARQGSAPSTSQEASPAPPDESLYPFAVSSSTLASRQSMRPARLALRVEFVKDSGFDAGQQALLASSLQAVLAPRPDEAWILLGTPGQEEDGSSADLVCRIVVEGTMAAMKARASLAHLDGEGPVHQAELAGKVDPYFRNAFAGLWKNIRKLLAEEIKPVEEYARILVKGRPGTRVSIRDEVDFMLGPEGGTYTTVRIPSNLEITSRYGSGTDTLQSIYLEKGGEIELKQVPVFPLAGEVWLHWLAYPGFALEVPVGDWFEAGLYGEIWDMALLPASQGSAAASATLAPRIDLGMQTRFWFMPPDQDIRLGFSAGATLHLTTRDAFALDEAIPASFHAGIPLSVNLGKGVALIFELLPTITVCEDARMVLHNRAILEASGYSSTASSLDFSTSLGNVIFEPLHFRLGLRIQP